VTAPDDQVPAGPSLRVVIKAKQDTNPLVLSRDTPPLPNIPKREKPLAPGMSAAAPEAYLPSPQLRPLLGTRSPAAGPVAISSSLRSRKKGGSPPRRGSRYFR
jgi:hypothetical protein